MTKEERILAIENAMELVSEAQNLVDEAVRGTSDENNYRSYGKFGFDHLLGNGNPYDSSLDTLLDNLNSEDEEEGE